MSSDIWQLGGEKVLRCDSVAGALLYLMKSNGNISQAELSRQTNIPAATLHKILTGQTIDPRLSTLQTLADFFGVGVDQIVGNRPMLAELEPIVPIPILNWGMLNDGVSHLQLDNWDSWTTVEASGKGFFALSSKPSMEPVFPRGSTLIVKQTEFPNDGDYVVVYYKDTSEATVREISIDGRIKKLMSFDGAVEHFDASEMLVIGIIVQVRYHFGKRE